jgi:hypothetical protein
MPLSRQDLAHVTKYEEFFELRQRIAREHPEGLAEFLLNTAMANLGDKADGVAGRLLIELEPRCPVSCEQVLDQVSKSNWNVSFKELPFYLISQFGKWNVLRAVESVAGAASLTGEQRVRVEGIAYWARMPTSELAKPLHYWEWQEVIEDEGNA